MAYQLDDANRDLVESYELTPSAWCLVKEHVPTSELPEIREVLGGALVDLCTETYSEVEMWVQIWREVCCKRGGTPKPPRATLADPPVVKELLKAEIRLLLLTVRERAAREGRDSNAALFQYSPVVVSYAMHSGESDGTQGGSSQTNGQEDYSRPQSAQSQQEVRASSRLSSGSSCEDDIKAVKHKLNVTHIDEVVAHLKSVLTEDCEAMKREIQFLQECVERKSRNHGEDPVQEPTVLELKEERKLIQMDLAKDSLHCHPTGTSPAKSSVQGGLRLCRMPVLPSPPPAGTTRPPGSTLRSPRLCQESPLRCGSESLRRNSDTSRPAPLPEKDTLPSGGFAVSVITMSAGPGCRTDAGLSPHSDGVDAVPRGGFCPDADGTSNSNPSLVKQSVYQHPVTSCITQPRPPERTHTHDDVTVPRLIPAPPTVQKPATRGQSVTRRLRLPQEALVSPT
ncbi:coiled-coil domain-containing protein 24 [Megalops cyprinoides]|uniref:coiled-coil domain-containing protein 24 n=1 Tax=Megalops cyprinoides TaxID=118141 RepID=UPI0018644E4C|nr:coiled-coil domain-containing protein 24 [Megalops cyprinoides]